MRLQVLDDLGARDRFLGVRQVRRAPDVDRPADLAFGDAQALDDQVPQVLGAGRQGLQALDLGKLVVRGLAVRGRLLELLAPGCQLLRLLRGQLPRLLLPRDRAPALGGEQEVMHVAGRDRSRRERVVDRGTRQPLPPSQRLRGVQAAASADERVAADQVQAEPRSLQALVHDVEPDRDLGQLDGGLVEVDAVAVVQGDVRLHPLQGEGALFRFEAVAGFLLTPLQVLGSELVDSLVEERA